jgi:hypothetical protein
MEAEVHALWEIVESLPVDTHDMGVHFWCDPEMGCIDWENEEE